MGPQSLAPPLVLTDWGLTQAGRIPSVPASHCQKEATQGAEVGEGSKKTYPARGYLLWVCISAGELGSGGLTPGSPTLAPLRDPCGYQLLGFVEGE